MGRKQQHPSLIAFGAVLLALGSGCVTPDAQKKRDPNRPDVTQPGALPPPQDMMRPAGASEPNGAVVQAGGVPPAPGPAGGALTLPGVPSLSKLTGKREAKVPATEMAVAWQPRIAYLPDPTRNGRLGAGIAGQMFLF